MCSCSTPHWGVTNVDVITDFAVGVDDILLSAAILTGIGAGALAANRFHFGPSGQAINADIRIIDETDNGNLWFDADGTGANVRVLFATLDAGLAMTNTDIFVV